MARKLPPLGEEHARQIEEEWDKPQEDWARKRLLVVRLIAQHKHMVLQIIEIAGVCRQSVFTYRDKLLKEGVEGLLRREWAGARKPAVRGQVQEQFVERLKAGKFRQARDAQAWIRKRTGKKLSESGVRKILRKLGGKLKMPRKSHAKKDAAKASAFKETLPEKLETLAGEATGQGRKVRIWVLDEHRYGLLR